MSDFHRPSPQPLTTFPPGFSRLSNELPGLGGGAVDALPELSQAFHLIGTVPSWQHLSSQGCQLQPATSYYVHYTLK